MTDYETGGGVVRRMLNRTLSNEEFRHRQHLELAYYYVVRHEHDIALPLVALSIRDFAAFHGHAEKFHQTLTGCWTRIVAAAVSAQGADCSFERLVAAQPELLDKNMTAHYYSRALLQSRAAREAFVAPDLCPLPPVKDVPRGV